MLQWSQSTAVGFAAENLKRDLRPLCQNMTFQEVNVESIALGLNPHLRLPLLRCFISRLGEIQKVNCAWSWISRTAEPLPKGPFASEFDVSNLRDPRLPAGVATFTVLNRLRAFTLKVRL